MVYSQVSFSEFYDSFHKAGRGKQFSYDGLQAIYEFYDSLSDDINEAYELDVIGICCEWSEMSIDEILESYNILDDDELNELDEDEIRSKVINFLDGTTTYYELDNGSIVIQQF